MTGRNRRTLVFIDYYPSPRELYEKITTSDGWPYRTDRTFYQTRDRALCAILYLLGLRVSEAVRLERSQFSQEPGHVLVRAIKLSKRKKGKLKNGKWEQGKDVYRQEGFLDVRGERAPLSQLVQDYLALLDARGETRLFRFGTCRAYQIVSVMLGVPCHWLRAYCENYLYDHWQKDVLAVADYLKIHPRTLPLYIRRSYAKYHPA